MMKRSIDDLIDDWHRSPKDQAIWEFLGWTREEYAAWVERPPRWYDRFVSSREEWAALPEWRKFARNVTVAALVMGVPLGAVLALAWIFR